MKADFELHNYTFLLYPSRHDVWRENASYARASVVELCNLISRYENVILGSDVEINERVSSNVILKHMEYNDIWIRDTGLIPRGDGYAVKFQFNAWGGSEGLYDDWSRDSTIPRQMNGILNMPVLDSSLTLEGGNLTTDGKGTLIAVRATIENKNRNPRKSIAEIEAELNRRLDIKKIIWIDEGLRYDETGGHIDNLCAFVAPKTVFLAWTDDEDNEQYSVVRQAYCRLCGETDAEGNTLEIVKIPLPSKFLRNENDCKGLLIDSGSKARLVGEPIQPSYINFVFLNGAVIVPQFGDRNDEIVLGIFKEFFKDRAVVAFPAREIVLGGGGLHCITKNI